MHIVVALEKKKHQEPYSEKGGNLQLATYQQKAVCLNFVCCCIAKLYIIYLMLIFKSIVEIYC
jgi:hypothetical protein